MDTRIPPPPPPPPPPSLAAPPAARAVYRELAGGARLLIWLFTAAMVVGLAGLVLDIMQFSVIGRILFASAGDISGNDARMTWLGWSQLVVSAGIAAAFITWLGRARRNLPVFGLVARRTFDPRSALDDVWDAASISSALSTDPWANTFSAHSLYRWWWPSVIAVALFLVGGRALALTSNVTLLRAAALLFVLGDVALIVGAVVGKRVVKEITMHMDGRALTARSDRPAGPAFVS